MTQPLTQLELEAAILATYRGPLDESISRPDALVKQLRAAKHREDAERAVTAARLRVPTLANVRAVDRALAWGYSKSLGTLTR